MKLYAIYQGNFLEGVTANQKEAMRRSELKPGILVYQFESEPKRNGAIEFTDVPRSPEWCK